MRIYQKFKLLIHIVAIFIISCSPQTKEIKKELVLENQNQNLSTDVKEKYLKISYIGNMGVLVESEKKTILFDGLHEEYKPSYLFPTQKMVSEIIEDNYEDYSEVEIILFTHNHRDHFSSELSAKFLENNINSILIGPNQICNELERKIEMGREISTNQLKEIIYNSEKQEISHREITITGIRCDHSNQARHKDIQNIAIIVELNGFKILHVGDTYWNFGEEVFNKLNLKKIGIDIAILPYWMLSEEDSKERVSELINPNKIVATHLPPDYSETNKEKLKSTYTNIEVFTELRQRFNYQKSEN